MEDQGEIPSINDDEKTKRRRRKRGPNGGTLAKKMAQYERNLGRLEALGKEKARIEEDERKINAEQEALKAELAGALNG